MPGFTIQIIAAIGSLLFLVAILESVRRKLILEKYALLWLFSGVVFLGMSLWRDGLDLFAGWVGIAYPPAALFLLLIVSIFLILIQFSVSISSLVSKNKRLSQEVAILRQEMESRQARAPRTSPHKKTTRRAGR